MTGSPDNSTRVWPGEPTISRRLPIAAYIVIIVVYLAILQGVGIALRSDDDQSYAVFTSVEAAVRGVIIPVGVSAVFAIVVVSVLGWWRPVMIDRRRVRPWVWIFPVLMLAAILGGTNYGLIGERGATLFIVLLVGSLMVGFAEELMYRGVGVVAFRSNGYSEGKVALWVALLFGLSHATNLISEGIKSLGQVLITIVAGMFFYLIRRVSGTILAAMLIHGLWDFGLLTSQAGTTTYAAGALLFIAADVILAILLVVRRHHIERPFLPHRA